MDFQRNRKIILGLDCFMLGLITRLSKTPVYQEETANYDVDLCQCRVSVLIEGISYLQTGTNHQLETPGLPGSWGHCSMMW